MNILKLELKRSILASVITLSVVLFSWANISVAQGNSGGSGSGNGNGSGGYGYGILIPNSELDAYIAQQNSLRGWRASTNCEDCGGGPGSPSDSGDGPGGGSGGAGNGPSSCMGLPSRRGNPAPRVATSAELKAFFEEERRLNEEDRLANEGYLRACNAARR